MYRCLCGLFCTYFVLVALMSGDDESETLGKDILTALSSSKTYGNFLIRLLPKSIRAKKWAQQLGYCPILEIESATVSNEAFALVVLANNWDTWLEPAK